MSFDPSDHFFKASYWSTAEDASLFSEWTSQLPKRKETDPYHCGPDAVNKFRMALALVRPSRVLEIGFNLGHSATLMLNLGVDHVTSVDIKPNTEAEDAIHSRVPRWRFTLIRGDHREVDVDMGEYDMIFIDGAHDFDSVCSDIALGKRLGVKWFLADDFDAHHGPGVQPAIAHHRLVPVAIFPNVALCVQSDGWEKRL